MNKVIACYIAFFLSFAYASGQLQTLKSPDGKIEIRFSTGNNLNEPLSYQLLRNNQPAIIAGKIRLNIDDEKLVPKKTLENKKRGSWRTIYGERKLIPENYNQVEVSFKPVETYGVQLTVLIRVYNEGIAYQYILKSDKDIVLKNESSVFQLPEAAIAWVSSTAQGQLSSQKIRDINNLVERPLTARLHEHLYLAFGEAALTDFARMKFTGDNSGSLITKLDGETKAGKALTSPWRYVLIGDSPADLLQKNYLLLNLNAPTAITDTKWIQPGKVLREVTLTTTGAHRAIDFAAQHNLTYILFDAGWYGREDHDSSDATRVALDPLRSKGPLDLKEVIRYGKEKQVGVLLYVNRRALERQLDQLLPLYQSWGVKGIKFGFVQVGPQKWTSWLHEAVRKCAEYHMMVDVHDEYRPTGYSRTYPNLLTQEGIRGDEESPLTEHTITTLFTRMIAGAADNTNCYFSSRVDKMGSHTAQMAKAVCIYSPLQFLYWYDRPKTDTTAVGFKEAELQEVPELDWYDKLPTTWDDTRVLEGDMQAFATIARRNGSEWYIGSLNGPEPRAMKLPLKFLDKGKKYTARIYTHDSNLKTSTHVQIKTINVDAATILNLNIGSRDGIAVHIISK